MSELTTFEVNHALGNIKLESEPEKLGKFISSLLGKPQKIKRKVDGIFDINKKHILNIIDTIIQRISSQNHGKIISFEAEVFFEDNFVRSVDSLDAFRHLDETKKLRSQAVDINIGFLIKFPSKETPEKQTINLIFSESNSSYLIPYMALKTKFSTIGSIYYEIANTERTWADDIDNLIKAECQTLIENETFFFKHQEKIINSCGIITGISLLAFPIYFTNLSETKIKENISNTINNIPGNFNSFNSSVEEKLSTIIKLIELSNQTPNGIGLHYLIFFFLSIFSIAYFSSIADKRKKSYVTIGETSEAYRLKKQKKENFFKTKFLLSFSLNIISGIAGSYLYAKYIS